jgi:hypothetical protein
MEVTLNHKARGDTLTFPVLEESGSPLFSVDFGKPTLNLYQNGELQPRFQDQRSRLEQYRIVSQLVGPTAYDDAILLADMIRSQTGGGEELTLQLSGNNLSGAYPVTEQTVCPAAEQQRALQLTYAPGRRNVVGVELTLTAVGDVRGSPRQVAQTPTESGSGPLVLKNTSQSVSLFEDITITRVVGRPNSTIRQVPQDLPNYTDHQKTAYDAFDIQFQFVEDGPAKAEIVAKDMIAPRLRRTALQLDFQGLFNMGSFSVVPDGSQAFRVQRIAGRTDVEDAPTLALIRVQP